MAFDACMMRAVLYEISSELIGARIEKVLQPSQDEIDLILHLGRQSRRLVLNVGPSSPRLQLSAIAKENPLSAPMFCMYLRKHIGGARLERVEQPGFDRIAVFTLSAYDEMGFATERRLVCEIMGKYANLILLDGDSKIMNAMKIVDFSASTVRQVLPGMKYQVPNKPSKLSPLEINKELFFEKYDGFEPERSVEKFISASFSGVATGIARELAYRATGALDTPLCLSDKDKLYSTVLAWQQLLISHGYTPSLALDGEGCPIDYSYMNISHLRQGDNERVFSNFESLFDSYFKEKDRLEKIRQRARDITTLLSNVIARTQKKLAIQRQDLIDSEKGAEYKKKGDLITANLYRLSRGMRFFSAVDYYSESCDEVQIELDERLSPAQNAQRFYKLYNKSKTAKAVLTDQIAHWEAELDYLESINAFLQSAESEDDLMQIREELYKSGYGSRARGQKPQKSQKIKLTEYRTSGGMRVLVGRNNLQNDYLSFKVADKDDIWFHVKGFHGSHAVLVTEGTEPSDKDYTEAAAIAAYHSQAKGASVGVDYTRVKNLKKPQGSKPGFVTYKTNYTAYVSPALPEAERKPQN